MKSRAPYACAVAVRDGADLRLLGTVCRGPDGDIYLNYPRDNVPGWKPHASYHASGQHHDKSFGHKIAVNLRQKPDSDFRGVQTVESFGVARSEPRAINEPCVPEDFDEVFEIPIDELGTETYRTYIAVNVIEPGARPVIDMPGARIIREHVIADRVPHIAITFYEIPPLKSTAPLSARRAWEGAP